MEFNKIYISLIFVLNMVFIMPVMGQLKDERKTEAEIGIEDEFVAAKLLAMTGKRPDAIRLLDSLRRISQPTASLYFELAKLHHENKDINLTESNLKSALQLEPDNIWVRRFEIDFSKELGRNETAMQSLNYLISLQPKQTENYDQLVQLYMLDKQYDKALFTLNLKEKNIGWSVNNTIQKAEILDTGGKVKESVSTLRQLIDKFPNEKKYYRLITGILHSNDMIEESEPYLRKILEIDPNDGDAKLGLLLLNKGKGSIDDYFTSLLPLVSNPDVPIDIKVKELYPQVLKHANSGDSILGNQLIVLCDKLVIAHPDEAKSHAIYGDVLKNNGNFISAIRQYEKTLSISKKNFVVWEQLMFCLQAVGNTDQLSVVAADAIDYFPNKAISYYFYAKTQIARNEFTKAESSLNEANMIAAGNPDIESRINTAFAEIYLKKRDWAKATKSVDQALLQSNNMNGAANELKGDILKEKNDMKNAAIFWQKAFDLGIRSQSLSNKLESVKNN